MDNFVIKKCEICENDMILKINKQKHSKYYGEIISSQKK